VGAAIEQIARKPTQSKGRGVAAPKQYCARLHHIVDNRAIGFCDEVLLQPAPISRGETGLVDVYLDGHRHAGQRTRVVSLRQNTVHPVRLRADHIRSAVNNRIDARVD
jgi:hypothetical protein